MAIELIDLWKAAWAQTEAQRKEYDLSTSGTWRVANAKRDPEDGDWWYTHGYKFFANWVEWRKQNEDVWEIAKLEDGRPAVELDVSVEIAGLPVKMYLDRVMRHKATGVYAVLDIKTGKTTPRDGLQPAFYRYGLKKNFGIQADIGYYWMARKQEVSAPLDLTIFTDDMIESLVGMFDKARKSGIFMANLDACGMCGYAAECEWNPKEKQ
jgi:hypothetical protein